MITINSVSPNSAVNAGVPLSFIVVPAGFTNPTYSVSDSYSGTTINSSNLDATGHFTWTPTAGESGVHYLTVYASDSAGHNASTNISLDINPGISFLRALLAPAPRSPWAPTFHFKPDPVFITPLLL